MIVGRMIGSLVAGSTDDARAATTKTATMSIRDSATTFASDRLPPAVMRAITTVTYARRYWSAQPWPPKPHRTARRAA